MHAADVLTAAMARARSIACIGLDPRPALIPPALRAAALAEHGDTRAAVASAFLAFNRGLIDATAAHVAAYKPQLACYEAYGSQGLACLEATVAYARARGVPVVADGKRNDIGSTAEHYAQAFLGQAGGLGGTPLPGLEADWLTVNGYLGSDGITPFLGSKPGHGIFVLVKTSNPSSGELQDRLLSGSTTGDQGGPVAEGMARLVAKWGQGRVGACGLNDVGAVVGATYPAQARRLRELMPETVFLVPGYGAQGGSAGDALAGRRPDGSGVLVNSSRAILGAWQGTADGAAQWQEAALAAVLAMNRDLAAAH